IRVTEYGLRNTGYGIRVTGYGIRDTEYGRIIPKLPVPVIATDSACVIREESTFLIRAIPQSVPSAFTALIRAIPQSVQSAY
ncbi:MAG TPA: hypothetical protein PK299_12330, partial [Anaerolineales bacterium]|nr:hypothetical protein [Anaerolineales bacterium]